MPNLENLRKQAKQILRWRRQGHYPVAAILREWLPRFSGSTDADVMASEFQLKDAQEVVARRNGFESWQALIHGTQTMNPNSTVPSRKPTLQWAEPQLFVSDMAVALEHYQRLGLSIAFTYGDPLFYAQVVRDGTRLNLRLVASPVFAEGVREKEELLAASLVVDDVKALFLEFQQAGIEFQQSLRKEPWGARTFIVKDPDGNLVLFAGS